MKYTDLVKNMQLQFFKDSIVRVDKMSRPPTKTTWDQQLQGTVHLRVGEWVEILHEYQQGVCSDGGVGCIVSVHEATDPEETEPSLDDAQKVDVKYLLDGRTERHINLSRITVIPMPFVTRDGPTLRTRNVEPSVGQGASVAQDAGQRKTPLMWLKEGLKTRKHERQGWLKDLMLTEGEITSEKSSLWRRILSDYKCQLSGIEGMKHVMGETFLDPRKHIGTPGVAGDFVSKKRPSQIGVPKNPWTIPYLLHAYGVSRSSFKRYAKHGYHEKSVTDSTGARVLTRECVISDRACAKRTFTAAYFFMRDMIKNHPPPEGLVTYAQQKNHYYQMWSDPNPSVRTWVDSNNNIHSIDVERYTALARQHDARQPMIKSDLLEALESNVCLSYLALARYIDFWCGPKTIERWFKSFSSYHLYAKNVKPGLTPGNREKQVVFAKDVHSGHGLPINPKGVLWVHSDEKWFHALVPRRNAKACEELGISKESYSVHHKSHIGKVMGHATVGYHFKGTPDDGGDGYMIGLHRYNHVSITITKPIVITYHYRHCTTNTVDARGGKSR